MTSERINIIPFRSSTRDAVYDVIDGERDYQDLDLGDSATRATARAAGVPTHTVGDFILLMERYLAEAREEWVHNMGGSVRALPDIRKVVALGVHALEVYGAPPRAYHVPVSANITGELCIKDLGDKTKPGALRRQAGLVEMVEPADTAGAVADVAEPADTAAVSWSGLPPVLVAEAPPVLVAEAPPVLVAEAPPAPIN